MTWLYYTLYFAFLPSIPRSKAANDELWLRRMHFAFRLARALRVRVSAIMLGDSNIYTLHGKAKLRKFDGVVIVLGVPGWTWFEWDRLLGDERFAMIFQEIQTYQYTGVKIVINCGGNHALQGRMEGHATAMRRVKRRFEEAGKSWCIDIPPVSPKMLRNFGPDAVRNVAEINEVIGKAWGRRTIMMSSLLDIPGTEDEYFLMSSDGIHYSDALDHRVRIPVIKDAVGI